MAAPRALSVDQREAVAQKYQDGLSIAVLAREYGCSGRAIWLVLKQLGVRRRKAWEFPRPFGVPEDLHLQVVDRYLAGEPAERIAKTLGYSARAVRRVLTHAGVHLRRGWAQEPGEQRRCPRCGEVKPIGAFSRITTRHGAKSRAGYCRACAARYIRPFNFQRRTGLTIEQFETLKAEQGGRCALCQREPKRLCVDHDHNSLVIRGLLCHDCNTLMRALDDPAWYARARAYQRTANTGWKWPDTKPARRTHGKGKEDDQPP